jgi:hypothetical protein
MDLFLLVVGVGAFRLRLDKGQRTIGLVNRYRTDYRCQV